MVKMHKKADSRLYYDFEVIDWSISSFFHIRSYIPANIPLRRVSFHVELIIHCKLLSLKIKNVSHFQVIFYPSEYRMGDLIEILDSGERDNIGYILKERGEDLMKFNVLYPADMFNNLHTSLGFNKIKYISITGDKTRYGQGRIYELSFSTEKAEF